jgi:hypothetical protein
VGRYTRTICTHNVEVVIDKILVVGTDIQNNAQRLRRIDTTNQAVLDHASASGVINLELISRVYYRFRRGYLGKLLKIWGHSAQRYVYPNALEYIY